MCQAVAAAQPEGVIVMDEGATAGFAYYGLAAGAPPFIYMTLTGGSIGQGLPSAVGAAAAAPDRRAICLEGRGASLYTSHSPRTNDRRKQNTTTRLFQNPPAYPLTLALQLARPQPR